MSKKDVVLIGLSVILGGSGASRTLLSIARTQIKNQFKKNISAEKALSKNSFYVILSRLKEEGLIAKNDHGSWCITKAGNMAVSLQRRYLDYQTRIVNHNQSMIIIFDIPERERKKRDCLRTELIALNFKQVQKSVWIGNPPIPRSFIEYLRDIETIPYLHIFTVQKAGSLQLGKLNKSIRS
ncbi:MAG: hypothetical protein AAB407_02480 [Patescibacteria group bacterium]